MQRPELIPEIIRAAGRDAGNRSAKLAGRVAWNAEDHAAASAEYERLARIAGLAP